MKQTDKNKVATLSEWLEIATRGLAAPGKERISREIQAHYAEAVQTRLAQGQSVDAARTAALTDLGKANAAAKRFRRSHLTEKEMEYLANLVQGAGKTPILLLGYLVPSILLVCAFFIRPLAIPLVFDGCVLALMICPTLTFMIGRLCEVKAKVTLLFLINWVSEILIIGAFPVTFFAAFLDPGIFPGIFVVVAIAILMNIVPRIQIWNKVRKMTADFDETTGIAG